MRNDPMADEQKFTQGLKNLLIAHEFYPGKYEQFKKNLALSGVPFVFTNTQFLEILEQFSTEFVLFLKENTPPEQQAEFEQIAPGVLVESISENLPHITDKIEGSRRQNIGRIAGAYVDELRALARFPNEPALQQRLVDELSKLAKETRDPRKLREEMGLALVRIAATSARSEEFGKRVKPIAEIVLEKADKTIRVLAAPLPSEEEITQKMFEWSGTDKARWLETYATLASVDPAPSFEVVDRLARVAEALEATPSSDIEIKPGVFSKIGVSGLRQPVQGVADALLSIYPKNVRDDIVRSVWLGKIEGAIEKTQERVGSLIVESPVFQNAIERGNKVFGKGGGRARSFIWDLASSIAGPPVAVDVFVLEVLGLAPESYTVNQVRVADSHSRSPGLFHLFFNEASGWGIRKATSAVVAKAGSGTVGRWFGGLVGAIGGLPGVILGWLGGSGFASFFGRRGPGKPQSFWASAEWIVIASLLFVVIGFPILFFFKTVSEFGPFQGERVGGGYGSGGPIINCSQTPEDPRCTLTPCSTGDCLWPTNGYITQGPYATCRSSHASMNAVDIGANYGTEVYSITDGTISDVRGRCADTAVGPSRTSRCNQGWGNYVDIETPNGAIIRYAHLSLTTINLVSKGQSVTKGVTQIGKVDNNGSSTSNHLHVGIQSGPGNILDLLPLTPSQAQEVLGCSNNTRGCLDCPVIQTGS